MISICPLENEEAVLCSKTTNLCNKFCQIERINPFASNEINYIDSIMSDDCEESRSFTDEFGLVSNNAITCPIIHYYVTDNDLYTDADLSLVNYNQIDGSFSLPTVTFPNTSQRYFEIKACVAGEVYADNSFKVYIYQKDCTEEAYIDYPEDVEIEMIKPSSYPSEPKCWSMDDLGFTSSEPTKCPLEYDESSLTDFDVGVENIPFYESSTGLTCSIEASSNEICCTITDDYDVEVTEDAKIFGFDVTIRLPSQTSSDTATFEPLESTVCISLTVQNCERFANCVSTSCDENALKYSTDKVDYWTNTLGHSDSLFTELEILDMLEVSTGCLQCTSGYKEVYDTT